MIRNVIAIKFKSGTTSAQADALVTAMPDFRSDGLLRLECGLDLGLRDGNWDFALTADFTDRDAYQRYDQDPEHQRIRREIAAAIIESAVRVQFESR
jgi:Stress responsive A/B Barrel Domain